MEDQKHSTQGRRPVPSGSETQWPTLHTENRKKAAGNTSSAKSKSAGVPGQQKASRPSGAGSGQKKASRPSGTASGEKKSSPAFRNSFRRKESFPAFRNSFREKRKLPGLPEQPPVSRKLLTACPTHPTGSAQKANIRRKGNMFPERPTGISAGNLLYSRQPEFFFFSGLLFFCPWPFYIWNLFSTSIWDFR